MSVRLRLTVLAATAVAAAVLACAFVVLVVVQAVLIDQVDRSLAELADQRTFTLPAPHEGADAPPIATSAVVVQVTETIFADGGVVLDRDSALRVTPDAGMRAVARGQRGRYLADLQLDGVHVRTLTVPLGPDSAVVAIRTMTDIDAVLANLTRILIGVALAGVALAAALGTVVARAGLRPLHRLEQAMESVRRTGSLEARLRETGSDELARMARTFNEMLAALAHAVSAQRQLVADASHELRTPLTSLRANVELLLDRGEVLTVTERAGLSADVRAQLVRVSRLIADLIDLAWLDEGAPESRETVRLDELAEEVVSAARRDWPQHRFTIHAASTTVSGVRQQLARALANLVDNAAKWDVERGAVEVEVGSGIVRVRDHGPGVPVAERERIFERFYRGRAARGTPGSGLGLAIAQRIVEQHGGSIRVFSPQDGGACFEVRLPCASASAEAQPPQTAAV